MDETRPLHSHMVRANEIGPRLTLYKSGCDIYIVDGENALLISADVSSIVRGLQPDQKLHPSRPKEEDKQRLGS